MLCILLHSDSHLLVQMLDFYGDIGLLLTCAGRYWTSTVIGLVALMSSVIMLHMALDGADDEGGLAWFGLGGLKYGEIQTVMYLKISLSDYGSVFNSRTRSWFWTRAPASQVVYAALFAVLSATVLSAYWPFGAGMHVSRLLACCIYDCTDL